MVEKRLFGIITGICFSLMAVGAWAVLLDAKSPEIFLIGFCAGVLGAAVVQAVENS